MSYIAYIILKSADDAYGAIHGHAPTIGAAIKDAAHKLNGEIAGSGGYQGEVDKIRVLTTIYAVPEGVEQMRFEIEDGHLRVFAIPSTEERSPDEDRQVAPILIMGINPIEAVRDQFIL